MARQSISEPTRNITHSCACMALKTSHISNCVLTRPNSSKHVTLRFKKKKINNVIHIFNFPFVRPGESHQRSLMILSRDSSLYHLIHILDGAPKPLVDSSQSPSQSLSKPCHLGRSSYLPVWRRISLHQKGLKLSQESRSYMQIIIYMRNASEQGNANILPGINLLLNMRPWSNLALVCLVLPRLYTRIES